MTNTYLDIAVVSVQSWLTRSPNLRGRRGASTLIREATDPDTIRAILVGLDRLVRINEDAGRVDGVVSLLLPDDDPAAADLVERFIAGHLRERLPAAALRAVLWRGENYSAARAANTSEPPRDWLPVVPEWPAGKPCDWCRSWTASENVAVMGQREDLCQDCLKRLSASGSATSGDMAKQPGTERDLLDRLDANGPTRVPDTMAELATLGKPGDDTHLATLHADGNAVGRFAEQVHARARHGVFPVAATIADATWSALLAGVRRISTGREVLPVVAHLVGGDDVLVTVPAHQVWPFVDALLPEFGDHVAARVRDLPGVATPSLSAGVVIHHQSAPLSTVVDLASRLLLEAKEQHRGQRAAVSWQSITHDGPDPITRPSVSSDLLNRQWPDLVALAGLSGSARARLAELCLAEQRGADPERLIAHCARLGLTEVVAPFLAPGAIGLTDALGMTRWWL